MNNTTTRERLTRVYSVVYYGPTAGPAGDGTHIARFRSVSDATRFAEANTCYGKPATVEAEDVPARIAQRWSLR